MKKLLIAALVAMAGIGFAVAQNAAKGQIKFEKTTHDFGTFSENNPVQTHTFVFTNVGDAPFVVTQATASCGCTVPSFTKEPVKPGKKGQIKVTYNGKGKYPGHFKKSISVRTSADPHAITRLYIEGVMEEGKK